jgi:DNA-directed RNA polymerase specialized sigma24 family protein
MRFEPFALQIYKRFLDGETITDLAISLGIPADRIETRIRAAALFCQARRSGSTSASRHAA